VFFRQFSSACPHRFIHILLVSGGTKENGAEGFDTFASQRLWRRHAGTEISGISGFFQFGIDDSRTLIAKEFFGGIYRLRPDPLPAR
jgi:hypothetical protein